jgi:hypothetical protein
MRKLFPRTLEELDISKFQFWEQMTAHTQRSSRPTSPPHAAVSFNVTTTQKQIPKRTRAEHSKYASNQANSIRKHHVKSRPAEVGPPYEPLSLVPQVM